MTNNPHSLKKQVFVMGAAIGVKGCEQAPECIKESSLNESLSVSLNFIDIVSLDAPAYRNNQIAGTSQFCQALAIKSNALAKKLSPFLVIGGNHGCAVGTWSGVSDAICDKGDLGLIWLDAHLDAHTPETSPSNNVHGMPVAALLGYGDKRLTDISKRLPALKPKNLVMIGIRSYEPEEQALLASLGVKIYGMEEVHQRGIEAIMHESIAYLEAKVPYFGISLDLDALELEKAPAVGTPVENGIIVDDLLMAFKQMQTEKLICFEITEFNPTLDNHQATEKTVFELIEAVMG